MYVGNIFIYITEIPFEYLICQNEEDNVDTQISGFEQIANYVSKVIVWLDDSSHAGLI